MDEANLIVIKDANDKYVPVRMNEIASIFINGDFRVAGMSLACIMELRAAYLERNGPREITVESIREVFSGK